MTTLLKTKVSTVVERQVPEFVRDDHDNFIAFFKAYYEFMEMATDPNSNMPNPSYALRNLDNLRDIDNTVDQFVEYLTKELMVDLPQTMVADKRLLAKHIKDLYTSKGSQRSYELLFRIMFGEEIEMYYPAVDILRVSDGKYTTNTVLKISEYTGNSRYLVGQVVTQPSIWVPSNPVVEGELIYINNRLYIVSYPGYLDGTNPPFYDLADNTEIINGTAKLKYVAQLPHGLDQTAEKATAVIEKVTKSSTSSELTLNTQSISGTFIANAPLYSTSNDDGTILIMSIIPVISSVNIETQGKYYEIGQAFTVTGGSGSSLGCEVGNTSDGSIDGFIIENPGQGYSIGDQLVFNNDGTNGFGAYAVVSDIDRGYILLENSGDTTNTITADLLDGYPTRIWVATASINLFEIGQSVSGAYIASSTYIVDKVYIPQTFRWYLELSQNLLEGYENQNITLTASDITNLYYEDETNIQFDINTSGAGEITQITLLRGGQQYRKLPSISIPDYLQIQQYDGTFMAGEQITTSGYQAATALVVNWDAPNRVLQFKPTNEYNFIEGITITGEVSGATAIIASGGIHTHNPPAEIYALSSDIGKLTQVSITSIGLNYESQPNIATPVNAIISRIGLNNQPFYAGEEILVDPDIITLEDAVGLDYIIPEDNTEGITIFILESTPKGYYKTFDTDINLLTINTNNIGGVFEVGQIIIGQASGARAKIVSMDQALMSTSVAGVGNYYGTFIGADGMISELSKNMIDSYYYQDFSYVIKVAQSVNTYRDAVKRLLHPVGMAMFGEVSILSLVDNKMPFFTDGYTRMGILTIFLETLKNGLQDLRGDLRLNTPNKDHVVLHFPEFVQSNMNFHILASELWPVIKLHWSNPIHYFILDMSVDLTNNKNHLTLNSLRTKDNGYVPRAYQNILGNLEKYKFLMPPYEAGSKNSIDVYRDSTIDQRNGKITISDYQSAVPTLGSVVSFSKSDYETPLPSDYIDVGLSLTRGANGALYNSQIDTGWENYSGSVPNSLVPTGTVWNADGWVNLDIHDIQNRTYVTLSQLYVQTGWFGNGLIGKELIMKDIVHNKYYTIKITSWTNNGMGGGFSYERRLIGLPLTKYDSDVYDMEWAQNDDGYSLIPLPFPVSFYDSDSANVGKLVSYTHLYVSTNGFITFGNGTTLSYSSSSNRIYYASCNLPNISFYQADCVTDVYAGLVSPGKYVVRLIGDIYGGSFDGGFDVEFAFYEGKPYFDFCALRRMLNHSLGEIPNILTISDGTTVAASNKFIEGYSTSYHPADGNAKYAYRAHLPDYRDLYYWSDHRWTPITINATQYSSAGYTDAYNAKYTFAKSTAVGGYDSQVYSKEGYSNNVYASAILPKSAPTIAHFGLNTDPSSNSSYTSLDYGFRFTGTSVYMIQDGSFIGVTTYAHTDRFTISYDGKYVRYFKNSTQLQKISRTNDGSLLYFDSSLYFYGDTLKDVTFGLLPQLQYSDTYRAAGTTQIKDFGDIVLADVINNPERRLPISMWDAYIDIVKI